MYNNEVSLQFKLLPDLKFYQKYPDFSGSLKVSDPAVNITYAKYESSSNNLHVVYNYN